MRRRKMNSNNKTARDTSYFQPSDALFVAAKDWAGIVEQFPYGLGALIFYFALFQSELVPRWLSGWGLVGATLILAMGLLRMYGHPVVYLAIPIILNELVLAVWFIVEGFNSSEVAYVIVGVLFITVLVSVMLNGSGSTDDPDHLTAFSKNENKVLRGVLFQIILTASVVAIPIILFPILREHNEVLALGYVGARIFEGFFDALIGFSMLMLLTLGREYVKAGTPNSKTDVGEYK
jgi:hypothetical protein